LIRISQNILILKNKFDFVRQLSKRKKTMPKGKKVVTKTELEIKSVNSHIPEEKFDQLMLRNIVTEMRGGKKVLIKCDFYVKNFYIQNKKGTLNIWHTGLGSTITTEWDNFKCRWLPTNQPPYIDRCCSDVTDNQCFEFKNFKEFDEKLKKQFICKYHVSCRENFTCLETNCSADYLVSPEEQCAICLNNIQQHLLEETKCGHKFCLSCLNTYVESKVGHRKIPCPTCRRNLTFCPCCCNAKYACEGYEDCEVPDDE
jgi:hypothetical protein